jgi:hypothetical protein
MELLNRRMVKLAGIKKQAHRSGYSSLHYATAQPVKMHFARACAALVNDRCNRHQLYGDLRHGQHDFAIGECQYAGLAVVAMFAL